MCPKLIRNLLENRIVTIGRTLVSSLYLRCMLGTILLFGSSAFAQESTVKIVDTRIPISARGKTGLQMVAFKKYVSTIDQEEVLGQIAWEKLFNTTTRPFKWDDKISAAVHNIFKLHVNKELEAYGYPIPKKRDAIFDTESKPDDAPLELGVLVRSIKLHFTAKGPKSEGQIYFDAKWALLNPKTQKVLLEIPTEGYFQTGSEAMTNDVIFGKAIVALTHNLMANPAFLAALSTPGEAASTMATTADTQTFSFAPIASPKGGTAKNGTMLCAAVVTIETNGRTGSGFYISRDGYLLTNRHVVGDSKFVKVRTATGRELPGEVVSVNTHRDVALIKTQKIAFDPLGIRQMDPSIGSEVYAIGSPLGDQFNGSITRGVLSGFREVDKTRYLQSDVSVLPGNSGGPLLDADGAVVGVTVLGLPVKGGNMNFFIPISEALTALSISFK
jgi:serine protease Do